jgi:hypothetical protein
LKRFLETLTGRIAASLVLGLGLGLAFYLGAQLFAGDLDGQAPQRIELIVPRGTAARIAEGSAPPAIPDDLEFVVGDTLVVHNEDEVSHQLGPIWVPAGGVGQLTIRQAATYAYACSFRREGTIDLRVRPQASIAAQSLAVLIAGLPIGILIGLYSLVLWPLRGRTDGS